MTNKLVRIDLTIEQQLERLGIHLSAGLLDILETYRQRGGTPVEDMLFGNVLKDMVSGMVLKSLRAAGSDPMDSKEEMYERARRRFVVLKSLVSEAVAAGFERGLGTYANRNVEYYCEIKPVPDAPTKVNC